MVRCVGWCRKAARWSPSLSLSRALSLALPNHRSINLSQDILPHPTLSPMYTRSTLLAHAHLKPCARRHERYGHERYGHERYEHARQTHARRMSTENGVQWFKNRLRVHRRRPARGMVAAVAAAVAVAVAVAVVVVVAVVVAVAAVVA